MRLLGTTSHRAPGTRRVSKRVGGGNSALGGHNARVVVIPHLRKNPEDRIGEMRSSRKQSGQGGHQLS